MSAPTVLWPTLLGVSFLIAGLGTYRRDFRRGTICDGSGLAAFAPAFIASALATFAGEHFTAASSLAQIVPRWLPARLFITYLVGAALLSAAVSFMARKYVRWSAPCLGLMFALFVVLMDLPAAIKHPAVRLGWSLAARETTYSIGALALFAVAARSRSPLWSARLATIARLWAAFVLVFYGVEHLMFPQFSPGVPDSMVTPTWVPLPIATAYATGILLVACGLAMVGKRWAGTAATVAGLIMMVLTIRIYIPMFLLARTVSDQVNGFNFVFDTLLFAGMMLAISAALGSKDSRTPRSAPA